jgi:hypothetical protein
MTLLHDPLHDLVGVVSTSSSRELESRSLVCLHMISHADGVFACLYCCMWYGVVRVSLPQTVFPSAIR